jgi:Spore Coat Protein U domain
MKKIITILLFLMASQPIYAACSLSFPSADLGTYNYFNGNSTSITFTSNCDTQDYNDLNIGATNTILLMNGDQYIISNVSSPFNNGVVYYLSRTSGNSGGQPVGIYGSGTFATTISVPNYKSVPTGLYIGNVQLSHWTGAWTYYNLKISLNVVATCSISASGIGFGTYLANMDLQATSTVISNCSNGAPYTVSADSGNSNNISSRQMKSGIAHSTTMSTPTMVIQLFGVMVQRAQRWHSQEPDKINTQRFTAKFLLDKDQHQEVTATV